MPLPLDLKENRLEVSTASRGRKRVPFQATITDRGRLELSREFKAENKKEPDEIEQTKIENLKISVRD